MLHGSVVFATAQACRHLCAAPFLASGGVNASIECSSTFTVLHADTLPQIFAGKQGPAEGCYLYGRAFNPTVRYLGRQLAALEGAEAAYCTSSGMAAISCTVLGLCNSGDHIVASNIVYGEGGSASSDGDSLFSDLAIIPATTSRRNACATKPLSAKQSIHLHQLC